MWHLISRWCAIFVWLLLASACSQQDEQPINIGTNRWPGYETLYLARDKGWLDTEQVRLVELPNSTDVVTAIRNGFLDGGALTLDEVLTLRQYDVDMRVVLVMDFSAGGDALLAKPGINKLADLKGKRVGVENTAVGAVMLDAALEQAGLLVTDIQVIPMAVNEHEKEFNRGAIDAVVTFDPVLTILRNDGANVLTDSSSIPGRIVDVLAVREEVMENHLDKVRMMIGAHFKARDMIINNFSQAATLIGKRLRMGSEDLVASYQGIILPDLPENRNMMVGATSALQLRAQNLARLMLDRGLLQRMPEVSHIVNDQGINEQSIAKDE